MNDLYKVDWPSCTARTLQRVIAIGRKNELNGVTLALVSLETYKGGGGILRFLIDFDTDFEELEGFPELHVEIRDESGRLLPSMCSEAGASGISADHSEIVAEFPGSGGLEVQVPHIIIKDDATEEQVDICRGPWVFDVRR